MVNFDNIGWNNDYIWADAEDPVAQYKTHVTVAREGRFYAIPLIPETGQERAEAMAEIFDVPIIPETRQIRKAMIKLVCILDREKTLPKSKTVAWY